MHVVLKVTPVAARRCLEAREHARKIPTRSCKLLVQVAVTQACGTYLRPSVCAQFLCCGLLEYLVQRLLHVFGALFCLSS